MDLYWPDKNLVVEVDGIGHGRKPTCREDKLKQRLLEALGYTVLRITDEELERSPHAAIARVSTCL